MISSRNHVKMIWDQIKAWSLGAKCRTFKRTSWSTPNWNLHSEIVRTILILTPPPSSPRFRLTCYCILSLVPNRKYTPNWSIFSSIPFPVVNSSARPSLRRGQRAIEIPRGTGPGGAPFLPASTRQKFRQRKGLRNPRRRRRPRRKLIVAARRPQIGHPGGVSVAQMPALPLARDLHSRTEPPSSSSHVVLGRPPLSGVSSCHRR